MADSSRPPKVSSEPPVDRRRFLRQSVASIGVTVHEYLKHRDAPTTPKPTAPAPLRRDWLRPPGAVEESEFLFRCTRCDDCVEACPHEVIQNHPVDETPILFPDQAPCQLCDDFPCIAACQTEALLPVQNRLDVKMGLAAVSPRLCTASQGCNACVSKCPVQAIHMSFSSFQIEIDRTVCVGCGICQHICQSVNDRVAIKIIPAREIPTLP
ncbi:MAG: 4Fe-4S ferredoxin [Nitrospirae bacterium]|nr:MAG: 4Fe-4S ferredoxin [Nitrospirota bacterium]